MVFVRSDILRSMLHESRNVRRKKLNMIAVLYSDKESGFDGAEARLLSSTRIGAEKPQEMQLVLDIVQ